MASAEAIGSGSPSVAAYGESGDIEKSGAMEQSGGSATPLDAEEIQTSNWKKPYQFYMASLSLWLAVLLVSLDSTGLAIAIPVYLGPARCYTSIPVLILSFSGYDGTTRRNDTPSFLG